MRRNEGSQWWLATKHACSSGGLPSALDAIRSSCNSRTCTSTHALTWRTPTMATACLWQAICRKRAGPRRRGAAAAAQQSPSRPARPQTPTAERPRQSLCPLPRPPPRHPQARQLCLSSTKASCSGCRRASAVTEHSKRSLTDHSVMPEHRAPKSMSVFLRSHLNTRFHREESQAHPANCTRFPQFPAHKTSGAGLK